MKNLSQHTFIVKYIEHFKSPDQKTYHIVMELAEYGDLWRFMKENNNGLVY